MPELNNPPNFTFHDCVGDQETFRDALIAGLSQQQKSIPCRFLYDARGSELFDQICDLPEYYPTRTEIAILRAHAKDIAKLAGPHACLIELGAGSSVKVRFLLDEMHSLAAYVPIDVSGEHLRAAAADLAAARPELNVIAICADYSTEFALPELGEGRRVGFFPGSTIGNLHRKDAIELLRAWRERLGDGGLMIIGADLKKDARRLEAAYDDSQGITEAFIRNIMVRANAELDANFKPNQFDYEAHYNPDQGRVEMYLRARADQSVRISDTTVTLAEGERIHVENSHKYDIDGFQKLAANAGYAPLACFTDKHALFSVHVLKA